MYAHERSLVEKFKHRPFVLLGVNSDEDRQALRQVIAKKNLNWRSWWDGGSPRGKTQGPIATLYNIEGWPTLFLIDANGVIRYDSTSTPNFFQNLDRLIESMVKETEAGQ